MNFPLPLPSPFDSLRNQTSSYIHSSLRRKLWISNIIVTIGNEISGFAIEIGKLPIVTQIDVTTHTRTNFLGSCKTFPLFSMQILFLAHECVRHFRYSCNSTFINSNLFFFFFLSFPREVWVSQFLVKRLPKRLTYYSVNRNFSFFRSRLLRTKSYRDVIL